VTRELRRNRREKAVSLSDQRGVRPLGLGFLVNCDPGLLFDLCDNGGCNWAVATGLSSAAGRALGCGDRGSARIVGGGPDPGEQFVDRRGDRAARCRLAVRLRLLADAEAEATADTVAVGFLVVGNISRQLYPGLIARRGGSRAGVVVGTLQTSQNFVDRGPCPLNRCGHFVPGCPELLDLNRQRTPAAPQIGHEAPAGLLHLLQERAALLFGPGDHGITVGHGVEPDPLDIGQCFLAGVGHHELSFCHPFSRCAFALLLDLIGPALRLTQEGRRTLLGLDHDFCRLVVRVAEDLGAVLAERGRKSGLVDDGMGRPFVGLCHRGAQLLLSLLEEFDAPSHRLQIRLDLVDVEAPANDGEGVTGDVPRRQAGGGNG
jgi:hypothetical protein